MRNHASWLFLVIVMFYAAMAFAGGPGTVGAAAGGSRPAYGVDGKPFTWNPANLPISYRVDPGPMSASSGGTVVIDHNAGILRVQNMFSVWQGLSTATLSFTNAGALLPAGSYTSGDLTTAQQFNDMMGSCAARKQNPVIFDANGKLITSLGLPREVIGFNSGCAVDAATGFLTNSAIVMNGAFQDGVNNQTNLELSASAFDEAITHEIGHFIGLDHSQINLDLLLSTTTADSCDIDRLAGLPLMFPFSFCQARKDEGLPVLSTDEAAWVSSLYPNASTPDNYGVISGVIYFWDRVTPVQGVNVIAREVDDPNTPEDESRRVAVSCISGYLFTGNPGQSVTASIPSAFENNTNGNKSGSRNPALIGYYQITVPPGVYTVEVESVFDQFTGGSSVGPLDPPIPIPGQPEFWDKNESNVDYPRQRDTITVHAGDTIENINIILNAPFPRFDQFEDDTVLLDAPLVFRIHPQGARS